MDLDKITDRIIAAGIEVHRALGPGLLESVYEARLSRELTLRGIQFEQHRPLPIEYTGATLDCGYRLGFLVENAVVVEIKSVAAILSIHEAQLLTYLKLGNWPVGLLMNFHVPLLRDGLRRLVNKYKDLSASSATLR
jgi:GxxExxY protein